MFSSPKNLISKGAAGLLLLATKALADDSDGFDERNQQIGFGILIGVTALTVGCCIYRCMTARTTGPAEVPYYGHYEQVRDTQEQDRKSGLNV